MYPNKHYLRYEDKVFIKQAKLDMLIQSKQRKCELHNDKWWF